MSANFSVHAVNGGRFGVYDGDVLVEMFSERSLAQRLARRLRLERASDRKVRKIKPKKEKSSKTNLTKAMTVTDFVARFSTELNPEERQALRALLRAPELAREMEEAAIAELDAEAIVRGRRRSASTQSEAVMAVVNLLNRISQDTARPASLRSAAVDVLAGLGKAAKTDTHPTPAQQKAGNYKKEKRNFAGLKISIENPKGSTRSGTDASGNTWSSYMNFDYGYILRSEGVDGDQVDVYLGDVEDVEYVYVIHQLNPETGEYDEDKVMLGFTSEEAAKAAYLSQYDSPEYFGGLTIVPLSLFKDRLKNAKGEPIVPESDRRASLDRFREEKMKKSQATITTQTGLVAHDLETKPSLSTADLEIIGATIQRNWWNPELDINAIEKAENLKDAPKFQSCLKHVEAQGHDAESAYRICYASLGRAKKIQQAQVLFKAATPATSTSAIPPEKHFFFRLRKADEAKEAEERIVIGFATSEDIDGDNQIVDAGSVKKALQDFMKWANLREMHGNVAAGTVLSAEQIEGEIEVGGEKLKNPLRIVAKIFDDNVWKKVKEGVYKGFSIGGSILNTIKEVIDGRTVERITDIILTEISLVDRPANPKAFITVWKRNSDTPLTWAEARRLTKTSARVGDTLVLNGKIPTEVKVVGLDSEARPLLKTTSATEPIALSDTTLVLGWQRGNGENVFGKSTQSIRDGKETPPDIAGFVEKWIDELNPADLDAFVETTSNTDRMRLLARIARNENYPAAMREDARQLAGDYINDPLPEIAAAKPEPAPVALAAKPRFKERTKAEGEAPLSLMQKRTRTRIRRFGSSHFVLKHLGEAENQKFNEDFLRKIVAAKPKSRSGFKERTRAEIKASLTTSPQYIPEWGEYAAIVPVTGEIVYGQTRQECLDRWHEAVNFAESHVERMGQVGEASLTQKRTHSRIKVAGRKIEKAVGVFDLETVGSKAVFTNAAEARAFAQTQGWQRLSRMREIIKELETGHGAGGGLRLSFVRMRDDCLCELVDAANGGTIIRSIRLPIREMSMSIDPRNLQKRNVIAGSRSRRRAFTKRLLRKYAVHNATSVVTTIEKMGVEKNPKVQTLIEKAKQYFKDNPVAMAYLDAKAIDSNHIGFEFRGEHGVVIAKAVAEISKVRGINRRIYERERYRGAKNPTGKPWPSVTHAPHPELPVEPFNVKSEEEIYIGAARARTQKRARPKLNPKKTLQKAPTKFPMKRAGSSRKHLHKMRKAAAGPNLWSLRDAQTYLGNLEIDIESAPAKAVLDVVEAHFRKSTKPIEIRATGMDEDVLVEIIADNSFLARAQLKRVTKKLPEQQQDIKTPQSTKLAKNFGLKTIKPKNIALVKMTLKKVLDARQLNEVIADLQVLRGQCEIEGDIFTAQVLSEIIAALVQLRPVKPIIHEEDPTKSADLPINVVPEMTYDEALEVVQKVLSAPEPQFIHEVRLPVIGEVETFRKAQAIVAAGQPQEFEESVIIHAVIEALAALLAGKGDELAARVQSLYDVAMVTPNLNGVTVETAHAKSGIYTPGSEESGAKKDEGKDV